MGFLFQSYWIKDHILIEIFLFITPIKKLSINNKKYKRYFLADSIYDSNKIKFKLGELNIKPIIPPNIKNTKDPIKIKNKQLSNKDKIIYKKRIRVENAFCYLQKNRRCQIIYDKYIETFLSYICLGFSKRLIKLLNS